MAEETPGNLTGGLFGGFMMGRAAKGNRDLDSSVDRLHSEISKLADALSRFTSGINHSHSMLGGMTSGGATRQSGMPIGNGGSVSFGGMTRTASGLVLPGPAFGSSGTPAGGGGGGGTPQQPTPNGGWSAGRVMAVGAGVAATGLAAYTANHYGQQMIEGTIAARGTGSSTEMASAAARRSLYNNGSAASEGDRYGTFMFQQQQSGFGVGSSGFNAQMGMIKGATAMSPELNQMQVAQSQYTLGTAQGFNNLRRMGINPLNSRGHADPAQVARQILVKINGSRVKTIEQVNAAFGPAGGATVTLQSYVTAGILDPNTAEVVKQQMFDQLMAQVHGMDYKQYHTAAVQAGGTGGAAADARRRLQSAGVDANTTVQGQREAAGNKIDSNADTLDSFTDTTLGANRALGQFRDILNGIIGLPGIRQLVGGGSALAGTGPGSAVLRMFGIGMAEGGVLPGYTPGRDVHKFFSPTGGALELSGGEGILIPQATKALGGEKGIKAINDQFRKRFAGGGVYWPVPGHDTGTYPGHDGVDINRGSGWDDYGDPIKAVRGGKVVYVGSGRGYGNAIFIRDSSGTTQIYGHTSAQFVRAGQSVAGGQSIGRVGNTGNSTAPHLHFGVQPGGTYAAAMAYLRGAQSGGGGGIRTSGGGNGAGTSVPTGTSTVATGGPASALAVGGGMFSELSALNFGGGVGAMGGPAGSPVGGMENGGSSGGVGGAVGHSGAGDVAIGAYNFKHGHAPMSDVDKIIARVDVFSASETRNNHGRLAQYLRRQGWGYQQGNRSDTGLAFNSRKYDVLRRGDQRIEGTIWNGQRMSNTVPYLLLRDKETGAKFWVMSAHTQVHGYKGGAQGSVMRKQYAAIRALYARLEKTGVPVFLAGDLNNPHPLASGIATKGAAAARSHGIDNIIYSGANMTGGGELAGTGFNGQNANAQMHSDHPFTWANFNLPGSGSSGGGGGGGSASQNIALGQRMAANMGWSGGQWAALKTLWMHESGWRTNADNPTSSAYGIPQALTSLHGLGAKYKNDPHTQIAWGLNYIKGKYGSPEKAWNFWQKNHWYDQGEWNIRNDSDARVHKGEMILPSKVADIVREELTAPGIRDALGGKGKSGKVVITFENGAIQIVMPSGSASRREAEQAGRWAVDAMMADKRMRQLAEGV